MQGFFILVINRYPQNANIAYEDFSYIYYGLQAKMKIGLYGLQPPGLRNSARTPKVK